MLQSSENMTKKLYIVPKDLPSHGNPNGTIYIDPRDFPSRGNPDGRYNFRTLTIHEYVKSIEEQVDSIRKTLDVKKWLISPY